MSGVFNIINSASSARRSMGDLYSNKVKLDKLTANLSTDPEAVARAEMRLKCNNRVSLMIFKDVGMFLIAPIFLMIVLLYFNVFSGGYLLIPISLPVLGIVTITILRYTKWARVEYRGLQNGMETQEACDALFK